MASFTFGAGNARKVLRLPLYALGALATLVVPRTPRLWVFGSGIGVGEGALPLYRLARSRLPGQVRLIWLAGTADELATARELGLDAELRRGWRGFRLTLRAKVLVVTHGFGDVNRYATRGGYVVQLWHGIPLKKLHLDAPAALRVSFLPDHRLVRAVMARAYRYGGRGISLFPVASALVATRIVSAFGVAPSRVVVTGDPRDDVLLAGSAESRRATARALIDAVAGPLPTTARLVLSAPTWRDGAADPGVPREADWEAIAAWLDRTDSVLLLRTHPLGRGDYASGPARSDRIRMLDPERLPEITPALPAIDLLITDYSSIAYDYSLLGGPIVFLAPDVEHYARARGLYTPYRAFTDGRQLADWRHVLAMIDRLDRDPAAAAATAAHVRWLRDEHIDLLDGRGTERVLAEILRRSGIAVSLGLTVAEVPWPATVRSRVTSARFDADTDGATGDDDGPALTITIDRAAHVVGTVRLDGARTQRPGAIVAADGVVTATFRLLSTRWGTSGLALPSGDYRLALGAEPGTGAAAEPAPGARPDTARVEVDAELPGELRHPLFRAQLLATAGGLLLRVSPPLADDERGPVAQKRLEREYRRARPTPDDAVFFESFYGQSASDNPLGIDRALAGIRPETRRYWSVVDASVAVPDGATRIVEGSREWWRVRAAARTLVVNDWLRKRYRPRPHQKVLQTWHGTMLKRLALDRNPGLRTRIAIRRESARWDALLAQNPYSAEIFRSAYAMDGPIWQHGYPRNDVFAHPERIRAVRAVLGLSDTARVVLYAPTWRDDRTEMVDYVDLASFAGELGGDHVLLLRGHSRTLRYGQDLEGAQLIDVTSYPDMSDLLQLADVFVTDYSSAMFDVVGTDKPMIFFTPDLAHYSTDLRGFYFDLLAEAPGPVVHDRDGLRAAVLGADAAAPAFAERRAAWRARFTPLDDGHAGERVVRHLLDEGWLG
ncbi:CDP-glycerol glycerophosphotransferase family protein [Lysinimonas soli]|uniref:CDP-glycerol glycerophosphotransferase family protein n=1 Tax=Lysinimonas soli TaxID=1074233 RepID=A0ABW0NM78_9MICO